MKVLESILIKYARDFPLETGKLRVINALWPWIKGSNTERTGYLIYGDFAICCDLRDSISRQIYFFGTYFLERKMIEIWQRFARQASCIFDIGANSGIYSFAALSENPEARVHAFEPTPTLNERLQGAVELNGFANLNVHELAVLERDGFAHLNRCRGGGLNENEGMNFVTWAPFSADHQPTVVTSLDKFCLDSNIDKIDLIKVDVQGGEYEVFAGAGQLLAANRIETIFFELNWSDDPARDAAGRSIDFLDRHGFEFCSPDVQHWRSPGDWMRWETDLIACHKSVSSIRATALKPGAAK